MYYVSDTGWRGFPLYDESLIKHVFPGGNTSLGFHSFYDYIADDTFRRTWILKGGPGVGKSTFMRYIGEHFLKEGLPVEYHHCSSDNDSLDGVVIPKLKVALMDGTTPHHREPKYPGVVDVVLDFSRFWQEVALAKHRRAIIALRRQIQEAFTSAYRYLKAAAVLREDEAAYYRMIVNQDKLTKAKISLRERIFTGRAQPAGRTRHLFASGITPQGCVHYLSSVIGTSQQVYLVTGPPGSGKSALLADLAHTAASYQLAHEVYHCALMPQKLEHLVIPALNTAVVTSSPPHTYRPARFEEIRTERFLRRSLDANEAQDMEQSRRAYQRLLELAVRKIDGAKRLHHALEDHYIPHMDFQQVNALRDETLGKIKKLASV
jgi:hypothetical protein